MKNTGLFFLIFTFLFVSNGFGQKQTKELTNSANVMFGFSQIVLDGFNIEGNLLYKRLAFDYSHGVSLNLSNDLVGEEEARQGLAIHIPYTTGFGVGYRFNDWLNLRVEPKWHQYELYYDGAPQTLTNLITSYTTFTLGLGLYGNIRPFKHSENLLKGIMIAPSIRWWPQVSSSLENSEFAYFNTNTEQNEIHQSRDIGMANSPFFVNISIGYGISF